LDIGLPQRTGLDVLAEIRAHDRNMKIIMLTGDTESYSPKKIYAAGADAFMYKTADASHFLEICAAVANGDEVSESANAAGDNNLEIGELKEKLSKRELQIVKLIVEGMSNKQAAAVLFISEHTVREHRGHVNQKLSIRSPLTLASFAFKVGLV
jgi:DNA-binding NarL/FixJ family response regulator